MISSIFFLTLLSAFSIVTALPPPRGFLLSCGSLEETKHGNLSYVPDEGFIASGNASILKIPNLLPHLSTLRFFPDLNSRKYCYEFQVIRGGKYLVRSTYYYGNFDGNEVPPVFDQIVQGTKWSIVNTTEDYAKGLSSYYEIIIVLSTKKLSFCLSRNENTSSSPFVSALEIEYLDDSVYNSTDFSKYALATVARHCFGHENDTISFPDDPFNRLWHPFKTENPVVTSHSSISSSKFWNLPPQKAVSRGITASRGNSLKIQWPPVHLPATEYYVALYFQDNRTPSLYSWRVFDVSFGGRTFYSKLNVTASGTTVIAAEWPLSGTTEITMTPDDDSTVGPVISAGEIFQILPLGGRTRNRDVMAIESVAKKLDYAPLDWKGDPCLPHGHSWTGLACSQSHMPRIISLNLTNAGISGTLSKSLSNLTALNNLWLGGNNLSGTIPELHSLKNLRTLHLENNQLKGPIPRSLGELKMLHEIFLYGNKLTGTVPKSLQNRSDINLKIFSSNDTSKIP